MREYRLQGGAWKLVKGVRWGAWKLVKGVSRLDRYCLLRLDLGAGAVAGVRVWVGVRVGMWLRVRAWVMKGQLRGLDTRGNVCFQALPVR